MIEYLNFHTGAAFFSALLVGGMTFFSFAVTPVVFRALERPAAGAFLSRAFPVYYRSMAACCLFAALLIFYRSEALWFGLIGVVFIALDVGLRPKMEALRRARLAGDEVARRRFGRLHRLSLAINLLQWAGAVILFFRLAA